MSDRTTATIQAMAYGQYSVTIRQSGYTARCVGVYRSLAAAEAAAQLHNAASVTGP